jgi:hypothetical protein
VNQQDQGQASTWYDLGSYNFSGTARVVVLSQSSGCSTSADAVRFVAGEAPDLVRIEIEGPASVNENSSAQYNCRAYYSDETDRLVQPNTWKVDPATYAQISATGLLSTEEVGSDEQVQIALSYKEGSMSEDAVLDVTIKDFVAPPEVTVDNGDPDTSSTGTWKPSGGQDYYGSKSVYSYRDSNATYTFTATVFDYQKVYMWWTWYSTRCSKVQVDIYDGDTLLDTVYVDQRDEILAARWNLLGAYTFTEEARVVIRGQGGKCSTCADAVKFE